MKGQDAIIRLRKAHKKPAIVFIHVDGYSAIDLDNKGSAVPDVVIFPHEAISELDLRFLIGLVVSISGIDHKRVKEIADACIKSKAARVISNYAVMKHTKFGGYIDLDEVEDTEGVLTWTAGW